MLRYHLPIPPHPIWVFLQKGKHPVLFLSSLDPAAKEFLFLLNSSSLVFVGGVTLVICGRNVGHSQDFLCACERLYCTIVRHWNKFNRLASGIYIL